jgi:predicted transcriptional regulator
MEKLDLDRSARNADLQEFGEEVLRVKRRRLGISQQEMARRIGINQSRVARIELGSGIPKDYLTAKKYVEHYKLNDEEARRFYQLTFGIAPEVEALPQSFTREVILDSVETIHQIRVQGNSFLAGVRADALSARLTELKKISPTSSKANAVLLNAYAHVLNERAWIYKETLPPANVPVVTKSLITEIQNIAVACRDKELDGLFNLQRASTFYMMGQYVSAIPFLNRALENLGTEDNRLVALRVKALSWSYLKERLRFEEAEIQIKRAIETGRSLTLERICQSLEGLGRAQGILRLPRALKTIEEGWSIFEKMRSEHVQAPFRHAQLVRSHLEIVVNTEGKKTETIEDIGNAGLQVAQQHGYPRHELIIKDLLEEVIAP